MNRRRSLKPITDCLPSGPGMLEGLAEFLTRRWELLLEQLQRTAIAPGIDEIHDLRVASRRLRAVLDYLEPFTGHEPVARIKRPVRQLTSLLGKLRNLDESMAFFRQLALPNQQTLLALQERQRHRAEADVVRFMKKMDCQKLEKRIRSVATAIRLRADITPQTMIVLLAEQSLKLYHPIHKLLPCTAAEQTEDRHSLRIAIKKWRYFNELLENVLGHDLSSLLEQLRLYQTLLGNMNDLQVFAAMIAHFKKMPASFSTAVSEQLQARQIILLAEYAELIEKQPLHYQFTVRS